MNKLFSLDSKLMRTLSRLGDLMLLNVLFIITSIPIFTIGAAQTALYTVCFRFGTDREGPLIRSYFKAFRDNFKQATGLWLVFLIFFTAIGLNFMLFFSMKNAAHYLFILCLVLGIWGLLIYGFTFPLLSQFENTNRQTVYNAFVLSLGFLPRAVLIAFLDALPVGLLILHPVLFLQCSFIWFIGYFSAAVFANVKLFGKVIAALVPGDDSQEPDALPEEKTPQQPED